ncbi:MAG: putative secondary metabolism biosynthetic enzyme [Bathelium mastoideum]|nr:MAG: putative secondary metabolism biosynthetic enzyme [Bathelium mastoideum]
MITGCGPHGIGQALATEFLNRGFSVIATLLPGEERSHLKHAGCFVHDVDVSSDASVAALQSFVRDLTHGYLDVLVNNAGICYQFPAVDHDMDMVEKLFAVNVSGAIRMVNAFHRDLIKAKGLIMNTCSIASIFPTVYQAAYCATKAALLQYANTLRIELAPLGVKVVNNISGEVNTGILKGDLGREIKQESVYAPMASRFRDSLHRNNPRMDPREYARGVVDNALKRNPKPYFWWGTWAEPVRFIDRFLPKSTFDDIATPMFHLDELTPPEERQFSFRRLLYAKLIVRDG